LYNSADQAQVSCPYAAVGTPCLIFDPQQILATVIDLHWGPFACGSSNFYCLLLSL